MALGLGCSALLGPADAEAAWKTKVLTAAEPGNSFDINLGVGFDSTTENASINREWVQDGRSTEVREFDFNRSSMQLVVDLRVGLFHDIEFHASAPINLQENTTLTFADGVNAGNSTVWGDTNNPNANDPTYGVGNNVGAPARYPITEIPAERKRGSFGDMMFGLAWSPLVDAKDESYPTLTLRADIIVPTGPTRLPEDLQALPQLGGAGTGLGLTTFDLSIGVSKRMRQPTPYFDPYMLFGAELPLATGGQKQRGMDPPFTGKMTVGTELMLHEDTETHQKYGFDVSFDTRYVGAGRFYSELSDFLPNFNQTAQPNDVAVYNDFANPANYVSQSEGAQCGLVADVPCGELNQVEQYMRLRGNITAHLQFAEYVLLRAGFSLETKTDHFLTTERVGEDLDDPSRAAEDPGGNFIGRVNASNLDGVDERSQYHDPRYDAVGRRFRLSGMMNYTFFVSGIATF